MIRKGPVADLNAWIKHSGRIEALLYPHKQAIQLRAKHRLHIFCAHPAIPMLSTNRTVDATQDRLVYLMIALHHLCEIVLVVHVKQGNNISVPISDMTENCN